MKSHAQPDLDTALMRVLASFAVVLLHLSARYSAASVFYGSLARFSVPVFLIISGYYLLGREYSTARLWKKLLALLGQMLLWSAAYYLFGLARGTLHWEGLRALARYLLTMPVHLWYLYAAAALYAFTPVMYVFVQHASQRRYLYALGLTFLLGSLVTMAIRADWWPTLGLIVEGKMHLPYSMGFLFLYLLGGYFRRYPLPRWAVWGLTLGWPLSVLATALLTLARSRPAGALDTLWLSFFSPFAMLGGAGCFASARAFLPRLRLGERAGRVLLELSQCAFGVYLLHPMLGELFAPWMEPLGWTWLTIPLRALAVYGAALGLVWLARRFWSMAVRRIRRASGRA